MKKLVIAVAFAGLLAGCADTATTDAGMGSTGAAMDSSGGGINEDRSSSATYGPGATNGTGSATSGDGSPATDR